MSPILRSCSSPLLVALSLASFSSGIAVSSGSAEASSINGRIKIPVFFSRLAAKAFGIPGKLSDAKVTLNGGSRARVVVSTRNPGNVLTALTEFRRTLSELVLVPLRDEQHYEISEPFSLMSLVKNPMGMMVGFMLVSCAKVSGEHESLRKEADSKRNEESGSAITCQHVAWSGTVIEFPYWIHHRNYMVCRAMVS